MLSPLYLSLFIDIAAQPFYSLLAYPPSYPALDVVDAAQEFPALALHIHCLYICRSLLRDFISYPAVSIGGVSVFIDGVSVFIDMFSVSSSPPPPYSYRESTIDFLSEFVPSCLRSLLSDLAVLCRQCYLENCSRGRQNRNSKK